MNSPRCALTALCFVLCSSLPALLVTPSFADSVPSVSNAAPDPSHTDGKPATVHVEGVILDESGGLLPGAKVHFAGQAGTASDVTADAMGSFRVDLPAGTYKVSAVQSGYQQVEQPVELHAGAQTRLTLTLKIEKNVETVTVTASEGYATTVQTTGSRVPIRVLDLPQSTYTVTQQLLQDRGVDSLKDALEGVPAVQPTLGEGRRDSFSIRGFNSGTDQYFDGVRDDAQYYRDLSNTEQLDVVEGPAAVLYGRGSSGGLVNRVTKKPEMEGLEGSVAVTGGSYGERRLESDTSDSWLHNTLGGRLTGAGEFSGNQRHYYYMNRYAFAPTLRWRVSDRTDMYAQVQHLRDERLPDRGIAAIDGPQGVVPIGNYYGYILGYTPNAPHDFIHEGATDETFDLRHDFENNWHLHEIFRHSGNTVSWSTIYLYQMNLPDGTIAGQSSTHAHKPGEALLALSDATAGAAVGADDNPVILARAVQRQPVSAKHLRPTRGVPQWTLCRHWPHTAAGRRVRTPDHRPAAVLRNCTRYDALQSGAGPAPDTGDIADDRRPFLGTDRRVLRAGPDATGATVEADGWSPVRQLQTESGPTPAGQTGPGARRQQVEPARGPAVPASDVEHAVPELLA